MVRKIFFITAAGLLIAALSFTAIFKSSESNEMEKPREKESEESIPAQPKSFEEIAKQLCEHNKLIIECSECQYEVGVVKVDRSLLRSPDNKDGLLETSAVYLEKPLRILEAVGEIKPNPNKIIRLRAKTDGIIASLKTDLGHIVKTDETILEIDSREYQELHLELLKVNSLLKLTEKNYQRENRLLEQKLTTEKEFLEAQSEMERVKIDMDTIARKLVILGLTHNEVQELLRHSNPSHKCYLPLRSPLDGAVIARDVALGELVETNSPLLTIADLSTVWVWVNLYEKDLGLLYSYIKKNNNGGVKAEVSVATYEDKAFLGKLDYIAEQMDEHSRTVAARIILDNPDGLLKTGMFAHCKLLVPAEKPAILIIQEALLRNEDELFVMKQVGDGLFFKQPVKTGTVFADRVEILEGLKENDRVVSRGAFMLKSSILREKMGAGCAD